MIRKHNRDASMYRVGGYRDKASAKSGLATGAGDLAPDSNHDMPVAKGYADLAKSHIMVKESLDMMCFVTSEPRSTVFQNRHRTGLRERALRNLPPDLMQSPDHCAGRSANWH